MLNLTILEGARGTGKSTLAFKFRQLTPETTLINPTGFHSNGEEGLNKVTDYYDSLFKLLYTMANHESNIILDRFYFSEEVFSELYKEYSFSRNYELFNGSLEFLSKLGVKIDVFYLTINDEDELKQRLTRDKVEFFKVEESVKSTFMQQDEYTKLFAKFKNWHVNDNLKLYTINTSGKSLDDVYNEILKLKATN